MRKNKRKRLPDKGVIAQRRARENYLVKASALHINRHGCEWLCASGMLEIDT